MPDPASAPRRARADPTPASRLRCRVRLADVRTFAGELPPARHRALQPGIVHADSGGLVELAAGARRDGRLAVATSDRPHALRRAGAATAPLAA